MYRAIGVDIGGTKIAVGIVTETGKLLHRTEVKSDPSDREKMFEKVTEAIENVLEESSLSLEGVAGIGVGVPGKVDRVNGIAVFQNNLPWQGFPIAARLGKYFGIERITIDNDVYMACFAEWKDSSVALNETFVYLTVSTGISSSIIHNGSFFRGAGFAGELGLIPVRSKSANNENRRLEHVASGPAIQKIAVESLGMEHLSTKDVFIGYKSGKPEFKRIIEEVTENLAQGLYSITCLFDPHKIVFGGSVMVNNPYLLEMIQEKLKNYQIPDQYHILENMSISTLRQDNGVVGAGLRVFEDI